MRARQVIEDDVAYEWLPRASRWIVGPTCAPLYPSEFVEKLEWIGARTRFIDAAVEDFLNAQDLSAGLPQIVVVGAGYDTRSARLSGRARFFEVDAPAAVECKRKVLARDAARQPDRAAPTQLALDLEELLLQDGTAPLLERVAAVGLDLERPALVLFEAVLFYLSPSASRAALVDGALCALSPGSRVVLTDSLLKLGVSPRGPAGPPNANACRKFFEPLGATLLRHDVRWGGALHFAELAISNPLDAASPL